ncbi:hypothetical protein ACXR2T_10655 [Leucobacter sp. HY1910]
MHTTFQRQGDPVCVGFTIGRAPHSLRGIRYMEGEGGAAPAAPAAPVEPAAPSPTDVAAMLAQLGKGSTPAAPATPAVQQIQGFTPDQVQKLMADNEATQQALAAMQTERDEARTERDSFKGQVAEHARVGAITTAADGKANAALLLDSAKFQAAIKDLDMADGAALATLVDQFVKDNPAYGVQPTAHALPGTSGDRPAGSTTTKPSTLEGAIAARLAG